MKECANCEHSGSTRKKSSLPKWDGTNAGQRRTRVQVSKPNYEWLVEKTARLQRIFLSRVFWLGQEKTEREVEKRLEKAITGQALEGSRNRPIRGCIKAWKE